MFIVYMSILLFVIGLSLLSYLLWNTKKKRAKKIQEAQNLVKFQADVFRGYFQKTTSDADPKYHQIVSLLQDSQLVSQNLSELLTGSKNDLEKPAKFILENLLFVAKNNFLVQNAMLTSETIFTLPNLYNTEFIGNFALIEKLTNKVFSLTQLLGKKETLQVNCAINPKIMQHCNLTIKFTIINKDLESNKTFKNLPSLKLLNKDILELPNYLTNKLPNQSVLDLHLSAMLLTKLGATNYFTITSEDHFELSFTIPLDFANLNPAKAFNNERALVIDDNQASLSAIGALLKELNIDTLCFASPKQALQYLRKQPQTQHFSVCFIDNSVDDFEYASFLNHIQNHPNLFEKVFLLTVQETDKQKILDPGIIACIDKPISTSTIIKIFTGTFNLTREKSALLTNNGFKSKEISSPNIVNMSIGPNSEPLICLVVEDNLVNMHAVSSILQQRNIDVLFAENGREAVDTYATAHNIDFVLMDIQMPEMDGIEATKQIRRLEIEKHVPIIALTAFSSEIEKERCLKAGMNGFISKPVHHDELFDLIDKLLNNNSKLSINTSPNMHAN